MKRLLDIGLSCILLLLFAPLILLTSQLVKRKLGKPVLFKQIRPGLWGETFELYKFRTMIDAYDANGLPLPDSMRTTPFGIMLRRFSLDELPQLLNVLKGDMSMVGPRPLLVRYLDRYTKNQARRHHVKPGITGWAQVNGRNAISWEQKFELDLFYVDHLSIRMDLKILFLTFLRVVRREGINAPGEVTNSEFTGTAEPAPPAEPIQSNLTQNAP